MVSLSEARAINVSCINKYPIERVSSIAETLFASIFVRDNKIILIAIEQNGLTLQYTNKELKNNKEFVLLAIKQNGLALQYASDDLKNNKEFVLIAIKQNGLALQYASDDLKNDKELVLIAIE